MEIRSEAHGPHVVVVTVDNLPRLNAITRAMMADLARLWDELERGPCRAIVLTGAGTRAFCAGADISGDLSASAEAARVISHALLKYDSYAKPIVAAVNGPAIGVGLTMILPFDRIVVADGVKLSVRFVKMGLVPELASSTFLPLRCGWGAANDLMLSGRTILADEAVRLGLADELASADTVLDVALERARSYAANPTPQLRWIKELLTQNVNETDLLVAQKRELRRLVEAYASDEHKVAVAAYLAR